MPNRIIREGLLDSRRYMSVDEGAQLLFDHIMLLADDFGCVSLEKTYIGRRCYANRPSDERLDRLIAQLVDADLVRLYRVDDHLFGFIPRFKQRLRRNTLKHPMPPAELFKDEDDAKKKFAELTSSEKNDGHRSDVGGRLTDVGRPEVEVEVEVEGKSKSKKPLLAPSPPGIAAAASPVVISIPLNSNGAEFQVTEDLVTEWTALYPAVDILQTLREIRGWNIANPSHRKTKAGVLKHINAWLAKEQNRG